MPMILDKEKDVFLYTGKISHMFRNCPKPDGWFGCFFKAEGLDEDIKITGVYPKYQLNELKDKDAVFNVLLQETDEAGAYQLKNIQLVPSSKHVKKILGSIDGIGKATIAKILKNFGADTYKIIQKYPEKLIDIGISESKVKLIIDAFSDDVIKAKLSILKAAPDFTIEQAEDLLYSVGGGTVKEAAENAVAVIEHRPYSLIGMKTLKITFVLADKIAMAHNFAHDCDERLYAAFYYILQTEFDKSIYIDLKKDFYTFISKVSELLNLNSSIFIPIGYIQDNFKRILSEMSDKDATLVLDDDALYMKKRCEIEDNTAGLVADLSMSPSVEYITDTDIEDAITDFESYEGRALDDYQREAVKTAIKNRISIIDGGPGRGKSSVAKCIIHVWESCTHKAVMLVAPTGKACNRLNEATDRTDAHTINSNLCKYDALSKTNTKTAKKFLNQWKETLIIIDESSMIGLEDARDLLRMCQESNIVFMGDVNQLPSIAYGQFFRDICDNTNIAHATLIINHRASGLIVDNAEAYNNGVHVENTTLTTGDNKMFQFYNFDGISQESNANYVLNDYLTEVLTGVNGDYNRLWANMIDTCILCPVNGGAAGVQSLNLQIQYHLNPNGRPIEFLKYTKKSLPIIPRVGDRIVFTVNYNQAEYIYIFGDKKNEEGLGICNGDCGIIAGYDDSDPDDEPTVILVLDDGRRYELKESECQIELGYALTIHKSQGSEYKTVIMSFPESLLYTPTGFACRNLPYTAITRAKMSCRIYGSLKAMNRCIDTPTPPRNSKLCSKIDARVA